MKESAIKGVHSAHINIHEHILDVMDVSHHYLKSSQTCLLQHIHHTPTLTTGASYTYSNSRARPL